MDPLNTAVYALLTLLSLPLLLTLYRNWFTARSSLNAIPGPFLARYTNLWRFFVVWSRKVERKTLDLHRRHGKVVRLGPNSVSVGDVNLIKIIYATKGVWNKSNMYKAADFVQGGKTYTTLFSTRDEAAHKTMFKPIARLYTMSNVITHEPLIDSTLERLMDQLDKRFCDTGNACEMDKWLHFFAWDVMGEVTFSEPFGFLEQGVDVMDIISTNNKTLGYISNIMAMPILDPFLDKNPIARVGPPSATAASNFAATRLFARMAENEKSKDGSKTDFLDMFLGLKTEYPDIEDSMLISYLMMNIIAGSDTTAISLRAAVYCVLKDKDIQAKLQAELDRARSQGIMSWKTAQTLPYLEAVIRETIRIHPPVGMELERVVPEGGLVLPDGQYLPAGVAIGINPWVASRDQEVYGKDVDKFIPERWLRNGGESQDVYERRLGAMKNADLGFGAGVRACYGKPIATLELYKTIATLFSTYQMSLVDPEKEWTTRSHFFVNQTGIDVSLTKKEH